MIDDEDDSGARVRGCDTYIIGPSEFDDPIKCKEYGVESVVVNDSETRTDSGTRRLEFPGKTHPSGYVVGLILEGRGDYDGSASFRIDRDLALGMESVRIDVTGEKTYVRITRYALVFSKLTGFFFKVETAHLLHSETGRLP